MPFFYVNGLAALSQKHPHTSRYGMCTFLVHLSRMAIPTIVYLAERPWIWSEVRALLYTSLCSYIKLDDKCAISLHFLKSKFTELSLFFVWLIKVETLIVLIKSSFWFRFRFFFIHFLPLESMDEKAEAEPKIALDKYYQYFKCNMIYSQVWLYKTLKNHLENNSSLNWLPSSCQQFQHMFDILLILMQNLRKILPTVIICWFEIGTKNSQSTSEVFQYCDNSTKHVPAM